MGKDDRDEIKENPTFYDDIQYFFDPQDVSCMRGVRQLDLANYESVKANAQNIYFQVKSGRMPPAEAERRWPENRVQTFRNWIKNKHPMGHRPLDVSLFIPATGDVTIPARRDAAALSRTEIDKLAEAFRGLMSRDPTDAQSYFALAGIHWFPAPSWCVHHQPQYNPWHRVYIDLFEDGLRTVPGCENVTLPYWDITRPPPAWMYEPPFDSYVLQADASEDYPAGTRTEHDPADEIAQAVLAYDIPQMIREALNDDSFEGFTEKIEAAHDSGHGASGPSMSATDIAAFDPLFWFFHCNWERLWWAWQVRHKAGTLEGFRAALARPGEAEWLEPGFDALDPFGRTTGSTIDISTYRYDSAPLEVFDALAAAPRGNIGIERTFRLTQAPRVSVRVKDIARLRMSGSFNVYLLADGEPIARRLFFQSTVPEKCPNCVNQPLVHVDFRLDRALLEGKSLRVEVEEIRPGGERRVVDPDSIGSPTVNIRELVDGE